MNVKIFEKYNNLLKVRFVYYSMNKSGLFYCRNPPIDWFLKIQVDRRFLFWEK